MDDAIKRSVERQFPELTGGYHLPRFAKVVAVADAPASAGLCDDFRPRFSVDLQVMGQTARSTRRCRYWPVCRCRCFFTCQLASKI
ncbi:hypothetical protein Pta6605_54060 [Pseudomonas amygdali pv. tabaci]|nr:hypothetical protein Pta6605_54060 [Pseudomonas amygdali pv. tabaci]